MTDIRDEIFKNAAARRVTACIYADMDGILCGAAAAAEAAQSLGLDVEYRAVEGKEVYRGDLLLQIGGDPKAICMAEDSLIGMISKASGVATAARAFVKAAGEGVRIVCGSWKKLPRGSRAELRHAAELGGAHVRISDEPMIYLDKNYVEILGGIQKALLATASIPQRRRVVQIRGRYENGDIVREAWTAVCSGADIVYVDNGCVEDLRKVTAQLCPALEKLQRENHYRRVEFAFGGSVKLEEVEAIRAAGADIIGVGRAIADAPLLDLRMEVTSVERGEHSHGGYNLLDKSELLIEGIRLNGTNLTVLAAIVAQEIGVEKENVLVIDVRDGTVALDVLQKELKPEQFVAKEETILRRLRQLPGVTLANSARLSSNGMLGWIAGGDADREAGCLEMERSRNLGAQLMENISLRVIVFPTGTEVESGEIEDTNTPLLLEKFQAAGFEVTRGEVLKDDLTLFSARLRRAAEQAYGVCITTGGVGAENKDYSVEAILTVDPHASAPYIARFASGHGRHSKDGIRIGVGRFGMTTFLALPGPNDEVALCADTALRGIREGWSREVLASELAELLRARLREKIGVKHSPF